MNKDKFLRGVGEIDDRLLERYNEADKKISSRLKKKKLLIRLASLAACFVMIWVMITAVHTPTDPPYFENAVYSAEDIENIFFKELYGAADGGGTNDYMTVKAPNTDAWNIDMLSDLEALPIYKKSIVFPYSSVVADRSEFEAFVNTYKSAVNQFANTSGLFEISERSNMCIVLEDKFYMESNGHYKEIWFESLKTPSSFEINGKQLSIKEKADDEEIIQSISDFTENLLGIFGKKYNDYKIFRYYKNDNVSSVYVYIYDEQECLESFPLATERWSGNMSEFIELAFFDENSNTEELELSHVFYTELTKAERESYTVISNQRKLTLEEAENMLKHGYFWGGGGCPFCTQQNPAVDFSKGYDAVSFTYITAPTGETLPFYKFYKKIGSGLFSSVKEYAYVYVPAIEISGLKEYFEAKESHHK